MTDIFMPSHEFEGQDERAHEASSVIFSDIDQDAYLDETSSVEEFYSQVVEDQETSTASDNFEETSSSFNEDKNTRTNANEDEKRFDDVNSSHLSFSDLGLPEEIQAAVDALGFVHPTAIQAAAIPVLLEGQDIVGVAQTGTGKTAAFGLPLLAHTDAEEKTVQALVLAPTRELAMQGAEAIDSFASKSRGLNVVAVYGGSSYVPQLRALERGAQVVVGTPGRVMDLIDRGALDLSNVRYFVLDEADEMLRMGFAEDVETIASGLPEERISALFSATMPPPIRRVAEQHLRHPQEVTISRPASTVSTVEQTYAVVPERHKIGALARVLAVTEADAALVFVRTRATAEDLAIELGTRGVATAALSGDVAQKDREKLVSRLRQGTLDVLVATDVAARGLDVERIGLVVNFDVPRETDTYVHRIGRTGRAGREGTSLTFVTPKERQRLRRIEKQTGSRMEQVELPTPAEVSRLRAKRMIERAINRHANGRLYVYEELLENFLNEQATQENPLSLEDLTASLLALAVRDPGPVAGEEPEKLTVDLTSDKRERNSRKERPARRALENSTRYRVEVGHKDRVKPGAIVGAITAEGGLRGSDLGHIDIYPTFSLVEIGVPLSPSARRRIAEARVSGRALRITEDRGPSGRRHDTDDFEPRFKKDRDSHGGKKGKNREERSLSEGPRREEREQRWNRYPEDRARAGHSKKDRYDRFSSRADEGHSSDRHYDRPSRYDRTTRDERGFSRDFGRDFNRDSSRRGSRYDRTTRDERGFKSGFKGGKDRRGRTY